MSTYPVLNDEPVDQWKVTELKDELQRRNLPIEGLKDDLVKRLFDAIQGEILNGGEQTNVGTPAAEELKGGVTPGPVDASVYQSSMEQNDPVICVIEASNESLVATTEVSQEAVIGAAEVSQRTLDAVAGVEAPPVDVELAAPDENHCETNGVGLESTEVSQEAVVGTAEVSQRTLDAVTEVEAPPVDVELAATDENHCETNGVGLESVSSDYNIVKEVHLHSEGVVDTIEKTTDDDTSKKMKIDNAPSEVTKQGEDPVTVEVCQRTLDAVAEVEAPPVDVALAATDENHCETNGVDLESASSGNDIVKEVRLHSEVVIDTIEKSTEDDTSKKKDIDDTPSDVTSTNNKLGVDMDSKILEQEAVTTPPDTTALHAECRDADVVAAAEAEDDTSRKMATDDVPSDFTSSNVKLSVNVDCKTEHEEVPTQPVAIVHANVVATTESVISANNFSENTLICGKDHEDPKSINGDCKTILCRLNDQVSEVNPDLGSQIKCVLISHDNISDLNADNSDLELEAKQEMVEPSSTIPSVGDDLQALDCDKELCKNGTFLQEIGSTGDIELDRKEDCPDGSSPEKLNFDRSSGDESMDEDVMESKQADSSMKSDDPRGKTEVTSEHVLKEPTLLDIVAEGSYARTEEVVAEEKPPTPAEKRKLEDQEVTGSYEQSKRQCQWNADTVTVSDQQASKLTGTGTRKELFRSALKRSFSRSDSSGDSAKERIVPPPQNPATTSLRIDRFVRPFTLKAVQELLGKTGSVCSFWMDHIKTHCYVTYSSVEEAVATRNAVYNLQWPPNNRSYLVAEFVDPQEVKLKVELPPPSQVPISPSTGAAPKAAPFQQSKANQTIPPHAAATSRGLLPTPPPLAKPTPTSDPGPAKERLPHPPKKLEPALTLDDLFKKTRAYPRIYYKPLSKEEVSVKLAARDNGKRG
uniref:SAP domain-containing protein n=1 Tax=Arundo donax TaxID=35708 RepID=A0A0A8XY03_ARUDO